MISSDFKALDVDERLKILEITVRAIATLLSSWRFDNLSSNKNRFTLIGDNGKKLTFYFCHQNICMVNVYFAFPKLSSWALCSQGWGVLKKDELPPSFRFGITKDCRLIAQKLKTAVLPYYFEIFTRCVEAKRAELEKRATVAIIADSFKRLAKPLSIHGDNKRPVLHFVRLPSAYSCDVLVDLDRDCKVTVDGVSADLALRILGLCLEGG
jgi:hypothetical protein